MKTLRAAAVQSQHAPGDKAANLTTVRRFVEQAAENDVKLIAFPECCISGYWHLRKLSRDELATLAEPVPDGPTTQAAIELSRQFDMTIGVGLVEITSDGRFCNTYVVAMPDGNVARHRKLHAFVSEHLSSGDEYTVFDTPHGWRVGVLICYDNNIVENARATTKPAVAAPAVRLR
jgi:predicted amidohydrolase